MNASQHFALLATDKNTAARRGELRLAHGTVQTPAFMPVGTLGTVKGLTIDQVESTGAEIILGNTYHLALRPGEDVVRQLGGLHVFSGWQHPILTDSGGFQNLQPGPDDEDQRRGRCVSGPYGWSSAGNDARTIGGDSRGAGERYCYGPGPRDRTAG